MIGVEVADSEHEIVREFFELFKTPWEFARPGEEYDVLVRTLVQPDTARSRLTVQYDPGAATPPGPASSGVEAHFGSHIFALYGTTSTTSDDGPGLASIGSAGLVTESGTGNTTVVRIGYSLFSEVRFLLTEGQPLARAALPSLEVHIALLRTIIVRHRIPLVELPPAPPGYDFMVCLSHDMDHPALRPHFFDHTMFGFLQRATVGTFARMGRGRLSAKRAARNFLTALSLPLVYLRILPDFWRRFDRFLDIERGKGATYFFIPRRGYAGRRREGIAPATRAAGYELAPLAEQIGTIASQGNEIAVHGLDAWLDESDGRSEKAILTRETGREPTGIRMHWLYFDAASPQALDAAGFSYDSTVGYNGTVGFRAGSTQAYRPPGTARLLELPLHAMDTALFYPGNLNLSDAGAVATVGRLADQFGQFGGALTINWHDRSIAPERLWDESYEGILRLLENRRTSFPTCGQAVAWFQARRAARFECSSEANRRLVRVRLDKPKHASNLRLRVYLPDPSSPDLPLAERTDPAFEDHTVSDHYEVTLPS